MGKTPKKAAPGGDERNLYVRRLKATTAPSKASETSLPERQRESESSNRPKLSGVQKKAPSDQKKNVKSKLRGPGKLGSSHPKRLNKPAATSKEEKTPLLFLKSVQTKTTNMQPESEEAEVKLNVSIQKESCENSPANKITEETITDKECVEHTSPESLTISEEQKGQTESNASESVKELICVEEENESRKSENDSQENICGISRETEESEENDMKLSFDTEESLVKVQEEPSNDKELKDEDKPEESHVIQPEVQNGTSEKEDAQSESQTDTESGSVNIVESTTSKLSELSEVSENNVQKEKEKPGEGTNNEASFVSYDSSIMLKDVQIKLNDCLKENSKLFDVSNAEHSTPNQPTKDMSFGKTLRNISGRHSISRMRHVTLREQRLSPNSSLFVNTSNMSLPPDDTADFKILRYSSGMSDTFSTNGSPIDRKRKLETEGWNSAKKQKTESENSLLNTSISLLKGLRRPIQVSTPSVGYKFQSNKLTVSGMTDDEGKLMNEPIEGTRKWCSIM